ncbi:hypothetical protein KVG29_01145 [Caldicoprobacter algeriensis]|uniref:hypothetical protein n=1 Tax=Caldicoprobacter algeriensis TaxID=699281 RepID=UPI00207AC1D3|nr:hypothetical protein [Caldicoprobacter algeriensis]MCM8899828.1 hypothetical protein [Caldicoprobacter algeriensis]
MLDIIILFIVISMVVANILKHTGSPGQWPKPDASGRPVMPRAPDMTGHTVNERDIYRRPGNRQVQMSGIERDETLSANQGPVAGGYAAQAEGFSIESPHDSSLEGMGQESLKDTPHDVGVGAVKLEIIPSDSKRHVLSFSRHAVINGIIMSELLQPPKALRRRPM